MSSSVAIQTKRRAGVAPAFIRERSDRWRHTMDDPAFRNCVKSGINVDAALTALSNSAGGRLRLPENGEIMLLGSQVMLSKNGLWLDGCGSNDDTGSVFQLNAAGAGLVFSGSSSTGVTNARFNGSRSVLPTSGAALKFSSCYDYFTEKLWIDRCFNGIDVIGSIGYMHKRTEIRQLYGSFGIRFYSGTSGTANYGASLFNPICDAPYPLPSYLTAANYVGAIARSTAYTLGKYGTHGGAVYQCVTAGTTASSGGPNGSAGVYGTTDASRQITDGTVTWQYVFSSSLSHILMDSYSYSLNVTDGALINGAYGFRMADTANDGSSAPVWPYFTNLDTDHALFSGMSLEAGRGLNASQCWVGSTLAGNGLQFVSAFQGEASFCQGDITGGAQAGVLINAGKDYSILGNRFSSNGQYASATYNNVTVAAGVKGFDISHNKILPSVGGSSQPCAYPIVVASGASDGYKIKDNISSGHATSNAIQDGGTGTNKDVNGNIAY